MVQLTGFYNTSRLSFGSISSASSICDLAMKIIDIAYTVYAVTALDRARDFYENTLGLRATQTFVKDNQGFIEYDIGPGTLAIGCGAPMFQPSSKGGVAALEVENFDDAVRRLRERNVTFLMEPHETPVCRMVAISDPDGNTLMIHKRKKG